MLGYAPLKGRKRSKGLTIPNAAPHFYVATRLSLDVKLKEKNRLFFKLLKPCIERGTYTLTGLWIVNKKSGSRGEKAE